MFTNPSLIRIRLYFLTLFTAYGLFMPFLTIYFKQFLQFSAAQTGILAAVWPVSGFLFGPQWCTFADKYRIHRQILAAASIVSSAIVLGLMFIPGGSATTTADIVEPPLFDTRFLLTLGVIFLLSIFLAPMNSILDTIVIKRLKKLMRKNLIDTKDPRDAYGRCRFLGSLAYGGGAFIISNLIDAKSCDKVKMIPMFLGWLLCAGILFPIVLLLPSPSDAWSSLKSLSSIRRSSKISASSETSPSQEKLATNKNKADFILQASSPSPAGDPKSIRDESDDEEIEIDDIVIEPSVARRVSKSSIELAQKLDADMTFYSSVKTIMAYPSQVGSTWVFWVYIFIKGNVFSIINNYLFLMMVQYLDADNMLLGYISLARVALEIPFFYYSGHVSSKLNMLIPSVRRRQRMLEKMTRKISSAEQESTMVAGMRWALVIASMFMTLRLAAITMVGFWKVNAWILLPIELTHASKQAPEHLQGVSQGLFNAIYAGFGPFVGSLVGGVIYGSLGPTALFGLLTLLTICSMLLYIWDIKRSKSSAFNTPVDSSLSIEATANISEEEKPSKILVIK